MNSSERVGTIRALWRYPVKSMLGEDLDAVDLSEDGVVGDRAYALRDKETGKVASAKHPRLWPNLLACRAAFVEATRPDEELPTVQIELADGNEVLSDTVRSYWRARQGPVFSRLGDYFETPSSWQSALEEHAAVLAAIRSRDAEAARAAMQQHLKKATGRYSASWKRANKT